MQFFFRHFFTDKPKAGENLRSGGREVVSLDFPDADAPDKMTLTLFQNQIGPETGGKNVFFQVQQIDLLPYLVGKLH